MKHNFLDYRQAEWVSWSVCSASCRVSLAYPVRYRTRDYCLNKFSSSYQCRYEDMVNFEPCNTEPCTTGFQNIFAVIFIFL